MIRRRTDGENIVGRKFKFILANIIGINFLVNLRNHFFFLLEIFPTVFASDAPEKFIDDPFTPQRVRHNHNALPYMMISNQVGIKFQGAAAVTESLSSRSALYLESESPISSLRGEHLIDY